MKTATKVPKAAVNAAKKLLKFFGPKGARWTHGVSSRENKDGVLSYCLSAAMVKLNVSGTARLAFRDKLGRGIVEFNDSHKTYTHVRRFLEKVVKG